MSMSPFQTGETRVVVSGKVIDTLLKRMIMRSPAAADRIVKKYAYKMADLASDYAPRSVNTGTNSRSTNPMADTIHVVSLGPNRMAVRTDASYAGYVIRGTRPHRIEARAIGQKAAAHRAARKIIKLENLADRTAPRSVMSRRRIDKKTGRELGGEIKRQSEYTPRELARYNRAANMSRVIGKQISQAQHEHAKAVRRMKSGKKALAFNWEASPQGNGYFVGPRVNHPGAKGNNFMGRARARIAPEFAREIRNWLEGGL